MMLYNVSFSVTSRVSAIDRVMTSVLIFKYQCPHNMIIIVPFYVSIYFDFIIFRFQIISEHRSRRDADLEMNLQDYVF